MTVPGVVVIAVRRVAACRSTPNPTAGQARKRAAIVTATSAARLQIGRGPECGRDSARLPQSRANELRGLRDDQCPGGDGERGEQPESCGDGER